MHTSALKLCSHLWVLCST